MQNMPPENTMAMPLFCTWKKVCGWGPIPAEPESDADKTKKRVHKKEVVNCWLARFRLWVRNVNWSYFKTAMWQEQF